MWGVILAGSLRSLLGVTPWYVVARCVSEERLLYWVDRYGKWLTIGRKEFNRAIKWFDEWGGITVLLHEAVDRYVGWITVGVFLCLFGWWLVRFVRKRRRHARAY